MSRKDIAAAILGGTFPKPLSIALGPDSPLLPPPQRRKKRSDYKNEERNNQVALFLWARGPDHNFPILRTRLLYHIPNGGRRDWRAAKDMKEEGVTPGVPDIGLDCARGGFFGLRMEGKAEKGRLSEAQEEYRRQCEGEGYAWAEFRSIEQGQAILIAYLSQPATRGVSAP